MRAAWQQMESSAPVASIAHHSHLAWRRRAVSHAAQSGCYSFGRGSHLEQHDAMPSISVCWARRDSLQWVDIKVSRFWKAIGAVVCVGGGHGQQGLEVWTVCGGGEVQISVREWATWGV
jgi:hypothetical protein